MKPTKKTNGIVLPAVLAVLALAPLQAQTTLIGAGIRNGDFNEDTSTIDERSFSTTPFWENLTGPQEAGATRTNLTNSSNSRNLLLNHASTVTPAQDTGHDILLGETYSISYEWRDAFNWDDATDVVRVTLFVTDDDTIGGTATVLVASDSPLSTADSTYEPVDQDDIYTAQAADVGKRLFVSIESVNTDGSGFGRLDDFELVTSSTVAPEALWNLTEAPRIVKMRENSSKSTSFTVRNDGNWLDLVISAPAVFGDPRFTLTSPTLPVSIAPGDSQTFEVLVDFSADSGEQSIQTTLTLATNDAVMQSRVLDLEGQILPGGRRILTDYDDGIANGIHEASIRNGGFEDGADGQDFLTTPDWISRFSPEGDTAPLTLNANPATGNLHGISNGFGGTGDRAHPTQFYTLDEWTLEEGDTIEVEFTWKNELNFTPGDLAQVIIEVFDANGSLVDDPASNPAFGSRMLTQSFTLDALDTYQTNVATSITVPPGSLWIGNRPALRILKNNTRDSYIEVDNVSVVGRLAPIAPVKVTNIDFNPLTQDVTIRFVDSGATSYIIQSNADLDFNTGTTNYLLDGSEDTATFPGEIEFTFNDPTATSSKHFWRVREN